MKSVAIYSFYLFYKDDFSFRFRFLFFIWFGFFHSSCEFYFFICPPFFPPKSVIPATSIFLFHLDSFASICQPDLLSTATIHFPTQRISRPHTLTSGPTSSYVKPCRPLSCNFPSFHMSRVSPIL